MKPERYVPALRFRRLTAVYDPLVERWTAARRIRRAVLEGLRLRPGLRLLELGCGPGRLAIDIKRRWPTVTIDAVDGDPEILQVARRNAAEAGVEIAFFEDDITRLARPDPYDRVYSTLVFHHLSPEGKREALVAARAALQKGGLFVVADFGRPRGVIQWLLFTAAGWLDGRENTTPHRDGQFAQALRDTFDEVHPEAVWPTVFGTIELFVCGAGTRDDGVPGIGTGA